MDPNKDKGPASTAGAATHAKPKPAPKQYPNETDAATLGEHGEMAKTVRRQFLTAFVCAFKGDAEEAWDAAEQALLVGQVRGHLP
jgi:hypothetical protein